MPLSGVFIMKAVNTGNLPLLQRLCEQQQTTTPFILNAHATTLLHQACYKGHVHIVQYLVEQYYTKHNKAIHAVVDKHGNTPLHRACDGGHLDVVRYLLDQDTNSALQTSNYAGNTALHFACKRGNVDMVQFLILHMTVEQLFMTNDKGETPLAVAEKHKQTKVASFLIQTVACVVETPKRVSIGKFIGETSPAKQEDVASSCAVVYNDAVIRIDQRLGRLAAPMTDIYQRPKSSPKAHELQCDMAATASSRLSHQPDVPSDIEYKDQMLNLNQLLRGERVCVDTYPLSNLHVAPTVQSKQTPTMDAEKQDNEDRHNNNMPLDAPSDIDYKDQVLSLDQLRQGQRVHLQQDERNRRSNHQPDPMPASSRQEPVFVRATPVDLIPARPPWVAPAKMAIVPPHSLQNAIAGDAASSLTARNARVKDRLVQLEQTLGLVPESSQTLKRVGYLEMDVFGVIQEGKLADRLSALEEQCGL